MQQPEAASFTVEELKEKCLASYAFFAELMQDDGWFEPNHKRLCDWMQYHFLADTKKKKTFKALIVLPRASLKSTIVTKYFPVWVMLRYRYLQDDDSVRTLIATNTQPNAAKKMVDIRGLFDSHEIFRAIFPDCLPNSTCQWTTEALVVPRKRDYPEATYESAGMKTKLTGRHYNGIIEDDTTAPDEDEMKMNITLPSNETIERAIGWHKASIPLLMPKGLSFSIVVTTRWADEDLVTYLQKHEDYRQFNLPAVQKVNGEKVLAFPSIYSEDKLEDLKHRLGPYMFSCLYLNTPMDISQRTFQAKWFSYVPKAAVPKTGFCSIAIDPAISEKDDACETAITAVQHVPLLNGQDPALNHHPREGDLLENHQYWWHAEHAHYLPNQQVSRTIDLAEWMQVHVAPVKAIIVETVAYQAVLKYLLEDEMRRRGVTFEIIGHGTRTNKDLRIQALQPLFYQGIIHFVQDRLPDAVESQLIQYPAGRLVDIVDCFTLHKPVYKYSAMTQFKYEKKTDREELQEFILRNRRRGKRSVNEFGTEFDHIETSMDTGLGDMRNLQCLRSYSHV